MGWGILPVFYNNEIKIGIKVITLKEISRFCNHPEMKYTFLNVSISINLNTQNHFRQIFKI